ncbi:reverse transcriptase domain-containing protein [Idiomarina abyssalis]|uniref:reverse transcriptase domain-containing protein n=1 Tax=Idiomarina abyssalis TaxID=86102 RepID=UPI001C986A5A|nr:reverse transcriptase domain-containing protein [Idiomarina abyssalis]QZN90552.1 reverse transcriptase family protein [Idiomarina abyssalis]
MFEQWIDFLNDRGVKTEVIESLSPIIQTLSSNKLPVIFEFEHLAKILGFNEASLASMINSPSNFYRTFYIPKRRGGKREICSPYPSLLECQRWIYKNILLKLDIHSAAHGFAPGRSIITNAKCHLSKNAVLKIDLKDFFNSIPINWVINLFYSLGYPRNISFYLASLCCLEGSLSQGAVTSPYLSNLLVKQLDSRLTNLSLKHHLVYSRYADDMSFSGAYVSKNFISSVGEVITDFGLMVNHSKTSLRTGNSKKAITGIIVSGNRLRASKQLKRKLSQEVHYIKKFGFLSHINKLKIRDPNYKLSLIGKLNFLKQVEPDNEFAIDALNYLRKLE